MDPGRAAWPGLATPKAVGDPFRIVGVAPIEWPGGNHAKMADIANRAAGLLVVILKSGEVRQILTDLVHRALTIAG